MNLWTEHSLHLIEPDSLEPEIKNSKQILHMARNSYESFQILVKPDRDCKILAITFDGFNKSNDLFFEYHFQETVHFSDGDFQDPLSNLPICQIKANTIQSIWITVKTEHSMSSGSYNGTVGIITDSETYFIDLQINVYNVVIPSGKEAAFHTEYWMNSVNFWFRYPNDSQLDFFHYYFGTEKYSDSWWALNKHIAQHMKANRINVLFVRTHDLLLDGGSTINEDGTYDFQWGLFDQWIDFFDKYADIKYFAGYHLVVQTEGKNIYVLEKQDGKMHIGIAPIGSEIAEQWMKQFLSALHAHLEERGLTDRWLQHIEDEPSEPDSWKYARHFVNKYMPGIRCMDAIDNQKPMSDLQGYMDLWIPRVDIYENNRDFYDYRLSQGDRRWIYNCCEPHHMNYMNKFLGWPLLHNRVLPWGCFVNHFNGFLHWGYNFWDPDDIWFGFNENVRIKGDGYIIYPDTAQKSIKNSIRMIATRDGAQDFELLKILADKNPKEAYKIAKTVALRFNDFNWDPEVLLQCRIELLNAIDNA